MNRLIISLLFIFTSLGIIAQRPRYEKMSPFVREAMASALATKQLTRSQSDDRLLTAFVRIDGNAAEVLRQYGCKELAHVGDISIAAIPLSKLGALSCGRQVKRIETGRRCSIQMDTTRIVVNAEKVYTGEGLSQSYTGCGVVVGVQDIGFDLTHPNFYSADMSKYRIKALWDQLSRDTIGSTLYVGRDYVGREALLELKHPIDGETQTHGTHTAGIAAGSGAQGNGDVSPYRGMACDADLVLVDNAADNASLIDPKDYYKFTYATDALGFKYIFDYAERMHQPCVINFSEGSSQDFHGYDQLYYELLAKLIGPGRIIVSSAGNDGARNSYIHKNIGKERAGAFIMGNEKRFSCTAKSKQTFTFRVSVYDNVDSPQIVDISTVNVCNAQDSLLTDSLLVGGKKYKWRVLAYPNSYDTSETAYDFQLSSPSKLGDSPQVSLQVMGRDADIELYRMSGYMFPHSLDPVLDAGDCRYTIFSPSSSPDVICVGSTSYRTQFVNYLGEKKVYDSGQKGIRSSFSAMGPTLDGRIKPDVMAPGQNIISSYSTFFINNPKNVNASVKSDVRHFEYNGRIYAWNANAGTSMSAPVVTGAIALWLEADPTLAPADCLEIFAKTCTHYDKSLSYPNNLYGYGQIDVAAGLREVLRRKALGINTVGQKKVSEQYDNRIYLLDGRYVGTSDANLPKGIYIRNGKKFVK
ncbi:S8 family serine peptidase [Prevotella melaninogenica]|uniref:S8 family serine peptidase n=1 Tax=Prevotella melaninogenica TaxID=28132 RepID=UPI001C5D4226|nr:S8 family serine peptidase [Prevotella melaninogenica]MBW4734793.1 S8 family serine peptidase [Prevotella melaninogenica]MBW4737279.1 S8 family serine peptidase [Prevotella melaninogenica]MBW4878906.1 S8 family serine peptidase [Prevotella melaninogenica]